MKVSPRALSASPSSPPSKRPRDRLTQAPIRPSSARSSVCSASANRRSARSRSPRARATQARTPVPCQGVGQLHVVQQVDLAHAADADETIDAVVAHHLPDQRPAPRRLDHPPIIHELRPGATARARPSRISGDQLRIEPKTPRQDGDVPMLSVELGGVASRAGKPTSEISPPVTFASRDLVTGAGRVRGSRTFFMRGHTAWAVPCRRRMGSDARPRPPSATGAMPRDRDRRDGHVAQRHVLLAAASAEPRQQLLVRVLGGRVRIAAARA